MRKKQRSRVKILGQEWKKSPLLLKRTKKKSYGDYKNVSILMIRDIDAMVGTMDHEGTRLPWHLQNRYQILDQKAIYIVTPTK